jgi:hypothetical protein
MVWFSNIKDLQYYNQQPGVPCYCEELVYAGDMMLQGAIPAGKGSGNYTISIEVWSPDGLTAYEVATSYFSYYFFVNPVNGLHYFTARLKSFSPAMCAHQCFLIRVGVTNTGSPDKYLFANWTERYCVSNCCDTAKGITVSQNGITTPLPDVPAPLAAGSDSPVSACNEPLIRLITKFDCYDNFTGDYYGDPTQVLSGAKIPFVKVTSMRGRIVRRPREINREMSYNCKLQSAESTAQYLLEGFEYFPAWKMAEIEGQLHASQIWVDDYKTYRQYQYAGGTPFKQLSKCRELFKLETMLEDCTQRQVFGCGDCAATTVNFDGTQRAYVIPAAYNGGAFYNESKARVADDFAGLLLYLRAQPGVTAVNDVDTGELTCGLYRAATVAGNGNLPSYLYFDSPVGSNRVFASTAEHFEDMCQGSGVVCKKPVAGTVSVTDIVCATPVVTAGSVAVIDITAESVMIGSYSAWIVDGASEACVYKNQVTFSISSENDTITEDPDAPAEDVLINDEVIGVMGGASRPELIAVLTHDNNGALPEGAIITIDNRGLIRYTGPATSADSDSVTVAFSNLVYNV